MNNITVEDKVILITGALGLIGKTITKHFLQQGAKVIISDINQMELDSATMELQSFSEENYMLCHLDITNDMNCREVVEASIQKFGKIDVLINNAALDAKFDKTHLSEINNTRFENYPIQLFEKSVHVNITGTILITQAVCRQMLLQNFGNIINVASTYSLVSPNQKLYDFGNETIFYKPVDYIVTKSFLPNFTRYIATFYAQNNIRCNAIAPHGIFNGHDEAFLTNFSALSPLGRMADKNEMTGPFTFLASDASSYMTGATLVVDGGWTAW